MNVSTVISARAAVSRFISEISRISKFGPT
jgi:hypothetical protein